MEAHVPDVAGVEAVEEQVRTDVATITITQPEYDAFTELPSYLKTLNKLIGDLGGPDADFEEMIRGPIEGFVRRELESDFIDLDLDIYEGEL